MEKKICTKCKSKLSKEDIESNPKGNKNNSETYCQDCMFKMAFGKQQLWQS